MAWMPKRLLVLLLVAVLSRVAVATDAMTRARELGVTFTRAPALRGWAGSGIGGDVHAHTDRVQNYGDYQTTVHEGTHGANSVIRNRYGGWDRVNAMYLGNDLAIVLSEPRVPLDTVAQYVPYGFQGMSYNLYFVQSLRDWRYNTLYLFDEWSAYINGTWAGAQRGQVRPSDGLQMAEFTVYVIAALAATTRQQPGYQAGPMRSAIAWVIEQRVMPLLAQPGAEPGRQHWRKFQTSPQAAGLRQFMKAYFGEQWTREVAGF